MFVKAQSHKLAYTVGLMTKSLMKTQMKNLNRSCEITWQAQIASIDERLLSLQVFDNVNIL